MPWCCHGYVGGHGRWCRGESPRCSCSNALWVLKASWFLHLLFMFLVTKKIAWLDSTVTNLSGNPNTFGRCWQLTERCCRKDPCFPLPSPFWPWRPDLCQSGAAVTEARRVAFLLRSSWRREAHLGLANNLPAAWPRPWWWVTILIMR